MPLERDCVSCGKTLKITEWGPNRTCPYCGKETVKVHIKEIHVSFSKVHETSWRDFLSDIRLNDVLGRTDKYTVGIDYERMRLSYELCYGDISDPPYSNANYYAHHAGTATIAEKGIKARREQLAGMDKSIPVYLWLSDNDADGLMNFLYFAKDFEQFDNVYQVEWLHTETDWDSTTDSMIDAIKTKKRITKDEMNNLYSRFKEIQSWNAECLIGNSELIEAWSLAQLEQYILACLSAEEYYPFGSIFMDVSEAVERDTSYRITYSMIMEAVHQMMLVGKIESHGACEWWGEGCYNNLISTQSFRIANHQCQSYTYDGALKIVAEAFEYGYTYPLYDLLDENAVLIWDDNKVVGRKPIIEYIENSGEERIHCLKQSVECAITKVEEGTNYQNGENFILVVYSKEEEKEYWLIKVRFNGAVIENIEITKPKGKLKLVAVE